MTATAARKCQIDANKLAKRLRRQCGQAIADYNMIEDGDRIMVCLSGGKDSYTLLAMLRQLQAKAPVRFELVATHLDQKQPGYDPDVLPGYLRGSIHVGDLTFGVHVSETYGGQRRKREVEGIRFRLEADELGRSGAGDHEVYQGKKHQADDNQ